MKVFSKQIGVSEGKNLELLLEEMRILKEGEVLKVKIPKHPRIVLLETDYINMSSKVDLLDYMLKQVSCDIMDTGDYELKKKIKMNKQELLDFYQSLTGNKIELKDINENDRFGKLFKQLGF